MREKTVWSCHTEAGRESPSVLPEFDLPLKDSVWSTVRMKAQEIRVAIKTKTNKQNMKT